MFKRIAITTSVLIVGGLLTWGGINRTQARASLTTEPRGEQIAAAGPGAGQGRGWAELTPAARPAQGDASAAPEERLRQGAGQQRSVGASRIDGAQPSGSRGNLGAESIVPKAWRSLTGTVTEIDAAHPTLRLADGVEVIVEGRPSPSPP